MKVTYLIVPAVTDQAGQCRIVKRLHEDGVFTPSRALADYRSSPDLWRDAGYMNSRGEIVCLDCSHPSHLRSMRRDQPLMAGTTYSFTEADA